MKNERQEKILAIIAASAIETQEQLIDSLRKEGISCAQNLVLIKTMAGLGPAAGAAFDGMDISAKVGTVAGDDTVLIVMRENESAAELCSEIEDMQRQRQTK